MKRSPPYAVGGLALAAGVVLGCGTGDAAHGQGTFEIRRVPLGYTASQPLVEDLDGDGRPEVVATGGGSVVVLVADPDEVLAVSAVIPAGSHPTGVAAGDLDGDARTDLAVANHDTDYLTLAFARDTGWVTARIPAAVSPHPHAVALADVDGDGRIDLLVDDRDAEAIRIHRNAGGGRFEPAGRTRVGGDPYRGMTVADVDGDGDPDVVTPNPGSVAVRLGDAEGGFRAGPTFRLPGFRPFTTAVGDFDGDGASDIAAGSGEGDGRAAIWLAEEGGGFRAAPGSPFEIGVGPTAAAVADVDGDGIDDLVVTSWVGDEVAVIHGGPDGHRVVRIELTGAPWGAAAGDLDGDGDTDVVVGLGDGDGLVVLLNVADRQGIPYAVMPHGSALEYAVELQRSVALAR